MQPVGRRAVIAGGVGLALGRWLPTATAKRPRADGATSLRLKVSDSVPDAGLCHLPPDVAAAIGVAAGQQLRLVTDDGPAVFTVEVVAGRTGAVSPGGRDRLGATKGWLTVAPDVTVVNPTMDRTTAAGTGEFIERAVAGGSSLVVLAPHGGNIEYGTDAQALALADRLGATAWYAAGWWPGGGAYRRWHVTSTRIAAASFPVLAGIETTGFDTAVAFHGWGEPHLAVGGRAPVAVRAAVRDAIAAAVDGAFAVRLATDASRSGTDPANVVNRVTASGDGGIQLEQPLVARREYADAVVAAVATVLDATG